MYKSQNYCCFTRNKREYIGWCEQDDTVGNPRPSTRKHQAHTVLTAVAVRTLETSEGSTVTRRTHSQEKVARENVPSKLHAHSLPRVHHLGGSHSVAGSSFRVEGKKWKLFPVFWLVWGISGAWFLPDSEWTGMRHKSGHQAGGWRGWWVQCGVLSVAEPLGVSELWAPGDKRLWIEEHNRTPKAMGRSRVRLREIDFLKGSCIIHGDQDMEAIKVSYDKRMDK